MGTCFGEEEPTDGSGRRSAVRGDRVTSLDALRCRFRPPAKRHRRLVDGEAKRLLDMREACDDALRELSVVDKPAEVVALERDIEVYRQEVSEQLDARERFVNRNAERS